MKKIITFLFSFFFLIKITYALENISINNLDLIPNFDKNIKVYNIYTSKNTEIITINTVVEANETVTGGGSKSLKKGLNVFTINSYFDNKLNKVSFALRYYRILKYCTINRGDCFLLLRHHKKNHKIQNNNLDLFEKKEYVYDHVKHSAHDEDGANQVVLENLLELL